eukprot:gb/GEZJ01002136.1/.p1 GENE.gb/GEZJ01002136.1/~~gb/GEZJ01002136.1/.p1  ORF type:complete len:112 (+),score=8.20 gb/GEZJ01002136.1/:2-337(+)
MHGTPVMAVIIKSIISNGGGVDRITLSNMRSSIAPRVVGVKGLHLNLNSDDTFSSSLRRVSYAWNAFVLLRSCNAKHTELYLQKIIFYSKGCSSSGSIGAVQDGLPMARVE